MAKTIYKPKQVPKGKASDLARAIESYKATEKRQGRKYTRSEDRRITSSMTETMIRREKARAKPKARFVASGPPKRDAFASPRKPRNTGPMGEERPNSRGNSRRTKRQAILKARPDTRYA